MITEFRRHIHDFPSGAGNIYRLMGATIPATPAKHARKAASKKKRPEQDRLFPYLLIEVFYSCLAILTAPLRPSGSVICNM